MDNDDTYLPNSEDASNNDLFGKKRVKKINKNLKDFIEYI